MMRLSSAGPLRLRRGPTLAAVGSATPVGPSAFAEAVAKSVAHRDGTIAKSVADLLCRTLGLPTYLFGALADRLAGVAHGAAEVSRGASHAFIGMRHAGPNQGQHAEQEQPRKGEHDGAGV